MKRTFIIFFIAAMTVISIPASAMSSSRVRDETRFLTDKMAYELYLSDDQYGDVYEINYDFINSIRNLMDDVVLGNRVALNEYHQSLSMRNEDLKYVLSDWQYTRLVNADYFYQPLSVNSRGWSFRIYITYTNPNYFYFGSPSNYWTYSGSHRGSLNNRTYRSYYVKRYHNYHFDGYASMRDNHFSINGSRHENNRNLHYSTRYNMKNRKDGGDSRNIVPSRSSYGSGRNGYRETTNVSSNPRNKTNNNRSYSSREGMNNKSNSSTDNRKSNVRTINSRPDNRSVSRPDRKSSKGQVTTTRVRNSNNNNNDNKRIKSTRR